MLQSSLHLSNRCLQLGAQGFIEIDHMLFAVGIYYYPVKHRPIVALFHQMAVGGQLHDVAFIGLLCKPAFDLHRNQAADGSRHYVILLAADA